MSLNIYMEQSMKSIRFSEQHFELIAKLIQNAEGKGWVNTVDIQLISNKIKVVDQKLCQLKIPKKYRHGIEYEYCEGGRKKGWANTATRVVMRYTNYHWYIISITRSKFSSYKDAIHLTERAKLAIPTTIKL